ncbi:hypothetical protein ACET8U_23085 [Aeromonas veronii]
MLIDRVVYNSDFYKKNNLNQVECVINRCCSDFFKAIAVSRQLDLNFANENIGFKCTESFHVNGHFGFLIYLKENIKNENSTTTYRFFLKVTQEILMYVKTLDEHIKNTAVITALSNELAETEIYLCSKVYYLDDVD